MELVRGTIIVIEVFSMLDYIPLGNIVEVAIEIVKSFYFSLYITDIFNLLCTGFTLIQGVLGAF